MFSQQLLQFTKITFVGSKAKTFFFWLIVALISTMDHRMIWEKVQFSKRKRLSENVYRLITCVLLENSLLERKM